MRFAVAEDQEQVDKLLRVREQCPRLEFIVYADPRGLRAYSEPGLLSLAELEERGEKFALGHADVLRGRGGAGRPGGHRGHLLHLGNDRQPQGRDAVVPEPDRDGPHRRRARGARARRRGARLPADGLGRRPHALLRAGDRRRLHDQLSGERRHGAARPQGDRADLLLRAAAHLGEPPHQRHDPHRGRGVAQAPADPLLPRPWPRRASGVGSPASRCRCCHACWRRSATCSSTARCATTSGCGASASPTPRARRSAPRSSSSSARSASTSSSCTG